MAKTKEHDELIEKAKGLGITSPHLFGEAKLKAKVDEAMAKANTGGKVDESKASDDPKKPAKSKKTLLKKGDGWLYHKTEQPRIFKDGEEVPAGWDIGNRVHWKVLPSGKFVNVNS